MSIEIIDNTGPAELTADVLYVLRCDRCADDLVDASRARNVAEAAIELGWRKVKVSFSNTSSLVEKLYCAACVAYIRKQQATVQAGV